MAWSRFGLQGQGWDGSGSTEQQRRCKAAGGVSLWRSGAPPSGAGPLSRLPAVAGGRPPSPRRRRRARASLGRPGPDGAAGGVPGGGGCAFGEARRAAIRRLPTFAAHLVGWRAPAVAAAAQESEVVFGLRQRAREKPCRGSIEHVRRAIYRVRPAAASESACQVRAGAPPSRVCVCRPAEGLSRLGCLCFARICGP